MSRITAMLETLGRLAIPIGLGISGLQASLYDVDGGERAVMFNRLSGVSEKTIGVGTHFRIPYFQTPYVYDVRTTPRLISTSTGSKDLQTVNLTLRVLSRPDVDQLPHIHQVCRQKGNSISYIHSILAVWIVPFSVGVFSHPSLLLRYDRSPSHQRVAHHHPSSLSLFSLSLSLLQTLGNDFSERVLPSLGNEVLKSVVAQYDAAALITQREFVSRQVREALTTRAREFNIILDDVSITHLNFGAEFTHAIEAKQVAQQEAERSKFLVMKAEQEKIAAITRAEGEAAAAERISEALKDGAALIELRQLDAAKDIADVLSRSRNVTWLPSSSGGSNLLLNLKD
eukprot:TRINITY_DN502_c1_g1_i1.p1 TRINITY_DN502_c1_g1~~TRINITY_DN502_c1_g1_i1.p1  ORF type:complete len:342 (+),score=97.31 TRINITY_DN502_c1_g1_i1:82-1107(+)